MTRMLPPQRQPDAPRRSVGRFAAFTGAAPARSPLRLRAALALFGLVFCGVAAGLFAAAGWTVPAILLCVVGATAVVDLIVIGRRMRQRRRSLPPGFGQGAAPGNRPRSGSYPQ
ncbi:hypothetical protein BCD49_08075 [Pseudofrankia sp. EUN1h]|nr:MULTISPECIES: DUF6343 family protein [Pseudofrankia]OHV40703.1 hypothetical protein BCD49_08075 [Pseudofrankia sp. EUN1h]